MYTCPFGQNDQSEPISLISDTNDFPHFTGYDAGCCWIYPHLTPEVFWRDFKKTFCTPLAHQVLQRCCLKHKTYSWHRTSDGDTRDTSRGDTSDTSDTLVVVMTHYHNTSHCTLTPLLIIFVLAILDINKFQKVWEKIRRDSFFLSEHVTKKKTGDK